MTDALAFPGWTMGQVLLPEQFLALQQTIVAHIDRRAELTGLPSHGLARLRWSEELLAAGSIRIDGLTWVFESGLLLDVPGNAVVSNLNLADAKADEVSLFLHVRNQTGDAAGLPQYAEDEPSVTRVIYQAELSLEDKRDDTRESGKLAELTRGTDGWALGGFSPPLLCVGSSSSPFLRDALRSSQRAVERIERHLAGRSIDAFLGADQLSELRRVRASAYRVLALLADHGLGDERQELSLHPYHVFSALRDFYIEVSVLQGAPPEPWPVRYRHGALASCFQDLGQRIDRYTGESRLVAPRLEFERKADWFVTSTFPEDLRKAPKVYLVAKPGPSGRASLEGLKLASPHRIEEVYTRALAGVRLAPLESASLSHTYGGDSALYEVITQNDEEWLHAVRERALCFRAWPELEGVRAALVWGG
jgi:type VI secretion system protein ImpJ